METAVLSEPLETPDNYSEMVSRILMLDEELENHFAHVLKVNSDLDRTIVSFQANKKLPFHRWYKYKEAFSSSLVEYFIRKYKLSGKVLDPFAGIGTTLFSSSALGFDSDGIELLPIGQFIIEARKVISNLTESDFLSFENTLNSESWVECPVEKALNELKITKGAYPDETKQSIEAILAFLAAQDGSLQIFYKFALLCILESISYTRKDGQYLRWDYRSGRSAGKKQFDKGLIKSFKTAFSDKVTEIIHDCISSEQPDIFTFSEKKKRKDIGQVNLLKGSCLEALPGLETQSYSLVITSPPYCNRYDYTRTYALELALLGCSEEDVISLRQQMLTCTVENRDKDLIAFSKEWSRPIAICNDIKLLQEILDYLFALRKAGTINNNGIPRMVKGYFYEMACVIYELFRVVQPGGKVVMVNDNVRYAGIPVSVDLILSKIAEEIGFTVDEIMVLPNGKGNSSQQMGIHGRTSLRKCVYVWSK